MTADPHNWEVTDKATGEVRLRCYDVTRSQVLEMLAERYGDEWAYGTSQIPPRFEVNPIQEPNG